MYIVYITRVPVLYNYFNAAVYYNIIYIHTLYTYKIKLTSDVNIEFFPPISRI